MPVSEAHAIVPRAAVRRICEADYDGPGRLTARVYDLTSEPLGLDLAQRWPPQANTLFFYQRHYFAVLNWREADRQALQRFVRELDRKLAL